MSRPTYEALAIIKELIDEHRFSSQNDTLAGSPQSFTRKLQENLDNFVQFIERSCKTKAPPLTLQQLVTPKEEIQLLDHLVNLRTDPSLKVKISELEEKFGLFLPLLEENEVEFISQKRNDPLDEIGKGSFSLIKTIDITRHNLTRKIALKYNYDPPNKDPHATNQFQRECAILSSLKHPNIVKLLEVVVIDRIFAMEYAPNGDLEKYINNSKCNSRWNIQEELSILSNIASALKYLLKMNILHLDLKTTNVLITENNEAKLCDFGFAREIKNFPLKLDSAFGSVPFVDPHFCIHGEITSKADVFALGMVMYALLFKPQLLFGHLPPSEAENPTVLIRKICYKNERPLIPNISAEPPELNKFATEITEHMKKCWDGDPLKRPKSSDSMRFFKAKALESSKHKHPFIPITPSHSH